MLNSSMSSSAETNRPPMLLLQSASKQAPTNLSPQSPQPIQQPSPFKIIPQPNPKVQQLLNIFRSPQPQSRSYRQTIEQIVSSFTMMDNLTNRLEQKVDMMLNNQKLEFIESYKSHMKKVKDEFQQIDKKMEQYEQKILYYENEGEMSHLVIKVNKLQEECKKLYKNLGDKDKIIRDHQLTMKVQKSQIKRYQKQLKLLMREKNQLLAKLQNSNINAKKQQQIEKDVLKSIRKGNLLKSANQSSSPMHSINSTNQIIFPTQLQQTSSNYKHQIDLSTQGNRTNNKHNYTHIHNKTQKPGILNQSSQKSLTLDFSLEHHQSNHHLTNLASLSQQSMIEQHKKTRELQLKKEISHLKKKNRILTSYQSHVLSTNTNMESFFINCVNEIKQQIKIKKKINHQLTLQEFKKQDKIQLLIKVLSNDDILVYLYERLFKKDQAMKSDIKNQYYNIDTRRQGLKSLYELGGQKETINNKLQQLENKQKLLGLMKEKQLEVRQRKQKALSHAKKRVSNHISQNSLLPKIHFHLEY